jgi:exopolysaccharide biosynthesis polyprenyl glycosylphosphotransferase
LIASSHESEEGPTGDPARRAWGTTKLWIILDVLTILGAAALATFYELHSGSAARILSSVSLFPGRSMWILLALLCEFTIALVAVSRRLHLYSPARLTGVLLEQGLSLQACLISSLLLIGTLYLIHAEDIPRSVVLITIGLVTVSLGLRRLVYRIRLYRRYDRGVSNCNVLIVGTGPKAHTLRYHLESLPHLGYTFKGFIDLPGSSNFDVSATAGEVVGTLETLFEQARKYFVDEIFFTTRCDRGTMQNILEQARTCGIDLRVVPNIYDDLAWNSSVEYIGQFPTIPLQSGRLPKTGLLFKRVFDVVFALILLIVLSPLLLIIAIAIKMDSPGPIFYLSARIGKKGYVFLCIKFRTMVQDAEKHRGDILHMNERDDVLFKIANDPRITKLGHFLRRYSLDELPQFFNVLKGDMSVVGPRPPIASEVKKYKLDHLRRLDVLPGITGLWQVQARQDPSFASYVSLDLKYIENWSIWLDFKIILRTIGVVFAGTGS